MAYIVSRAIRHACAVLPCTIQLCAQLVCCHDWNRQEGLRFEQQSCKTLQGANDSISLTAGDCVNVAAGTVDGCGELVMLWGMTNTTWINNIGYAVPRSGNNAIVWQRSPSNGNTWTNNLTFNGTVGQNSVTVQGTTNDTANLNAIIANNTLLGTDPKLANVGTKDFRPLPGSPLLGAGIPGPTGLSAYTVDGFAQPSPPNIGALAVQP